MRAVDLIQKKKEGYEHTKEEIYFLVENYMKGEVTDYQMSAWLMAVCFKGLTDRETAYLTQSYIDSGEILDFSAISDKIADKHSTGGVGDKVTIALIPILASLGVTTAKLSGRGLGFTGGTVDKLESIPGFKVELSKDEFFSQVKNLGAAISSQSPNLTPADGKIYALRDVTATVDNKSLIAASVISKKIASGATSIVLDVTYGSGAFIKTKEAAKELGDLMVKIGAQIGRKVDYIVTSMEQPLGYAVGNSLEIIEAIDFLKGKKIPDLYEVIFDIVHKTLSNFNMVSDKDETKKLIEKSILEGKALAKLREIIEAQKGNTDVIYDYSLLPKGKNKFELKAPLSGKIENLDALDIAKSAKALGAGRDKKTDPIDYGAGVILKKKLGDDVQKDDTLIELYYNDINQNRIDEAKKFALDAFVIK